MFNESENGLGEVAAESPSLWDSFSKLVSTGVSAGFNIYNKVQNIQAQKQQTVAAQAQAKQIAQMYGYGVTQPMTGVQPGMVTANMPYGYQQPGMFDGWTMPLLIAGVAAVGIFALRK